MRKSAYSFKYSLLNTFYLNSYFPFFSSTLDFLGIFRGGSWTPPSSASMYIQIYQHILIICFVKFSYLKTEFDTFINQNWSFTLFLSILLFQFTNLLMSASQFNTRFAYYYIHALSCLFFIEENPEIFWMYKRKMLK